MNGADQLGGPPPEAPRPASHEIIKPTAEDIPQLLELWKQQYDFHHNIDPEYYAPFTDELRVTLEADLRALIEAEDPHILVAKNGEAVDGFITFGRETDAYYDANIRDYGVLKEILVTFDSRGSGLGRKLITAVEDSFREQGVPDMMIQCSSFNPNALAVYNAMGYTTRQELLYKKLDT